MLQYLETHETEFVDFSIMDRTISLTTATDTGVAVHTVEIPADITDATLNIINPDIIQLNIDATNPITTQLDLFPLFEPRDNQINMIDGRLTNAESTIATNTADIAINTTNIANNATNIANEILQARSNENGLVYPYLKQILQPKYYLSAENAISSNILNMFYYGGTANNASVFPTATFARTPSGRQCINLTQGDIFKFSIPTPISYNTGFTMAICLGDLKYSPGNPVDWIEFASMSNSSSHVYAQTDRLLYCPNISPNINFAINGDSVGQGVNNLEFENYGPNTFHTLIFRALGNVYELFALKGATVATATINHANVSARNVQYFGFNGTSVLGRASIVQFYNAMIWDRAITNTELALLRTVSDGYNSTTGILTYSPQMPCRTTLGRIYFVSAANTTIATTTLNTWVIFPANPATITPIRNSGHFSVNAGGNRITNISNKTMWVRVDISFQINNATNASLVSYEFQWRLTGVAFGQIYRSASGSIATNSQSTIISGFGYIQMAPGAYIEPFVRNTEDNSNTTITTCSIAVTEDSDAVVQ